MFFYQYKFVLFSYYPSVILYRLVAAHLEIYIEPVLSTYPANRNIPMLFSMILITSIAHPHRA